MITSLNLFRYLGPNIRDSIAYVSNLSLLFNGNSKYDIFIGLAQR